MTERERLTSEVEATLAQMEADLLQRNPGVNELLRVYGTAVSTVEQLDAYLGVSRPSPVVATTDATTFSRES